MQRISAQKLSILLFFLIVLLLTTLSLFYFFNSRKKKEATEPLPTVVKSETFPVVSEGVQRFLLSGQLEGKPSIDENGFLIIRLEVDNKSGGTRKINVHAAIPPSQDGAQTLPLTKAETLSNNLADQLGQESTLLSIENITSELQNMNGEKIALSILIGEEVAMQNFFDETFSTDCTGRCRMMINELKNSLTETVESFNSLQSEDASKDELTLIVLVMNIYVEK